MGKNIGWWVKCGNRYYSPVGKKCQFKAVEEKDTELSSDHEVRSPSSSMGPQEKTVMKKKTTSKSKPNHKKKTEL